MEADKTTYENFFSATTSDVSFSIFRESLCKGSVLFKCIIFVGLARIDDT